MGARGRHPSGCRPPLLLQALPAAYRDFLCLPHAANAASLTGPPTRLLASIRGRLQFPYPILNKLPFPLGFLGFVVLGFVVVLSTFQMGKLVKGLVSSGSSGGSEARSDGEPPVSGPAAGEAGEKKKER